MIEYWILAAVDSNVAVFMACIEDQRELLMRGYKKPFVTSDLYPDHQTDDRMELFYPDRPFFFLSRTRPNESATAGGNAHFKCEANRTSLFGLRSMMMALSLNTHAMRFRHYSWLSIINI